MTEETLLLGAPEWAPAAITATLVALGVTAWCYRRGSATPGIRALAIGLKATGIGLLALCLVEPLVSGLRPQTGANLFLVAADDSRSLAIRDAGGSSRREALGDLLKDDAAWQTRLAQDFDVRRYAFDAQLRAVENFGGLKAEGVASSLGGAIEQLTRRYRDRPVAGLLLFTDGNATDKLDTLLASKPAAPIYPVVLGDDAAQRDVSVTHVTASQTGFEDAPVTVQAEIATTGCRGEKIVARLVDEAGKNIEEQTITAGDDDRPTPVRFQLRPERPGTSFYQVRVAAAGDKAPLDDPATSREAATDNNRRLIAVDRGGGPYRVLYVSGRPNWEYKFLRRAIDEDEQVQLTALVRIAKREPKFDFRSRSGEGTNPLFRGFGNQNDETAETYDKPVLVRLGTLDEIELRDGFPKSPDELYRYHAVVVDDLEAEFFSADQMLLLQKFVGRRGGGLLMLGGQESFAGGKYDRTPLGEMLPVYLDRLPESQTAASHRLELGREGWLQPWVRLRATEPDEKSRLEAMPPFVVLNRVRGVKPGALVLADAVADDGARSPALVEQRFGKGRVLATTVGDLWRWGLRSAADEESPSQKTDLDKAWRQMLRRLVADVPEQIEIEPKHEADDPSKPVEIRVRAVDKNFEPLDNAVVTVKVKGPDGGELELTATADDAEAGAYRTTYVPRLPGAYRAEVTAIGPDGADAGRRATGWTADPAADEFRSLRPNRALMQRLAEMSGGEVVEAENLATFVADLQSRKAPITERSISPLWHTPWVFALAIACLCGEWGLRRWKGMA